MSRNLFYRRISTSDAKQNTGRQLHDTDIVADAEYEDKKSGSEVSNRTGFRTMCKDAREGDTIHIQSNDRAFRNVRLILEFLDSMLRKKVRVHFHSENLIFDNDADPYQQAMARLTLQQLAAVSEFFLAQNSAAIKQGLRKAKSEGVKVGAASANYGKKKRSNPNQKRNTNAAVRAETSRESIVAVISALPKPTYQSIADALTRAKVPLPSGSIGEWKCMQVSRLCKRLEISIY